MVRYIDADKLKQRKRHIEFIMSGGKLYDGYDFVKFSDIDETPTADVQEVKHGRWKVYSDKYPRYVCTNCNHLWNNKEFRYCPTCGAKMDGKDNGK